MIGGLICQGIDPLSSIQMAVYFHGLAGDRVVLEKGEKSLVASDLIHQIPAVLQGGIESQTKVC
jgi:NAD(P)H-hydrate repair Nnr-like enzyme with NAD(P)H-hydrate dehydratase domain